MTEEIVVSHRGQDHVFGRGDGFYGIWRSSAHELVLVEHWPATAAGWFAAWSRFNALEARTEGVDDQPSVLPTRLDLPRWPLVLLAAGIFCSVAGLFAPYLGGTALTTEADQLVPHICYIATWVIAAMMLGATRQRAQAGAVIGFGVSVLSLGFFLSDIAEVAAEGAHLAGAGLVLGAVGWLLCAAGSTVALRALWRAGVTSRPGRPKLGQVIPAAVLGIGAAATFAPAWDRYVLHAAASGQTTSVTAGNAFSNPGWVIAANVATMALIALVPVFAMLWRPSRLGAFLLAGALVPLCAQIAAAFIGSASAPPLSTFGISAAEANQAGISVASGLTAVFWVYGACVLGLIGLGLTQVMKGTPWAERARALWSRTTDATRRAGPAQNSPRSAVSAGAPLPVTTLPRN